MRLNGWKTCGLDERGAYLAVVAGALIALGCPGALAGQAQAAPVRKPAAARHAPGKTVDLTGPYNAYLTRLRAKVLPHWDFPAGRFHVVLVAEVNADGSVGQVKVTSSPASEAAQRAADAAFAQAQPLEPLPPQSPPRARVTISFDSSYDPHGDSQSSVSARMEPLAPPGLQPAGAGSDAAPPSGTGATP